MAKKATSQVRKTAARRRAAGGARHLDRQAANDTAKVILAREVKRLRRLGGKRQDGLATAYEIAAQTVAAASR